jgi:hypothetical protein
MIRRYSVVVLFGMEMLTVKVRPVLLLFGYMKL